MKLTSQVFNNLEKIPELYTCDSKNISLPLQISEVPLSAKSLVLIMEDPDVPKKIRPDCMWDHWIIFNIPPNTKKIEEGKNPIGLKGLNTSGGFGYTGPCPPDKEHRYFFKLYALDANLNLKEGSTKKQIQDAMKGSIIEETILVGTYERKK